VVPRYFGPVLLSDRPGAAGGRRISGTRLAGGGLALAAALAAAACGSGTRPTAPAPAAREIVVFGDSLAVSPSRADAFPAVLQARLNATHPGWTVVNQGVSGDTTGDGLRRLDPALGSETAILVLELGANDGLRGVAVAAIEANLSTIIERAQARRIRVLLCGMETPPFNGFDYTRNFHNLFPRLAAKYQVPLVPFLLEGVVLNPDLNGADEVHPNAAGARRIADTVWPYLEPLVAQSAAVGTR
jgi:acyl-CoA thioesterase I